MRGRWSIIRDRRFCLCATELSKNRSFSTTQCRLVCSTCCERNRKKSTPRDNLSKRSATIGSHTQNWKKPLAVRSTENYFSSLKAKRLCAGGKYYDYTS